MCLPRLVGVAAVAFLVLSMVFVSPALADNTNLISVTDGQWWADSDSNTAPIRDMQIVNKDGRVSWEVPLSDVDWGVDHNGIAVFPGDHVVFSCWIKTSAPTIMGDDYLSGGRIGVDIYGGVGGASFGTSCPDGLGHGAEVHNTFVVFGTDVWTKVTIDFVVAASYVANQVTNGFPVGTVFVPSLAVFWFQTWSCVYFTAERGSAWFADPVLQINPSSGVGGGGGGWVGGLTPSPVPNPTEKASLLYNIINIQAEGRLVFLGAVVVVALLFLGRRR